jgi:hypothetical protein
MQEEEEEEAQLVELQRQSLIESLIGMGFPLDWALRAVEHCDMPASQDNAMSWILERMTEIDQEKMDEGGDSSRAMEQEEIDEAATLESLRLQQQRISTANTSATSAQSTGATTSSMDAMVHAMRLGMTLGQNSPAASGLGTTVRNNSPFQSLSGNNQSARENHNEYSNTQGVQGSDLGVNNDYGVLYSPVTVGSVGIDRKNNERKQEVTET